MRFWLFTIFDEALNFHRRNSPKTTRICHLPLLCVCVCVAQWRLCLVIPHYLSVRVFPASLLSSTLSSRLSMGLIFLLHSVLRSSSYRPIVRFPSLQFLSRLHTYTASAAAFPQSAFCSLSACLPLPFSFLSFTVLSSHSLPLLVHCLYPLHLCCIISLLFSYFPPFLAPLSSLL